MDYFYFRSSHCQRILLFAESPSGSRRINEKKGGKIFFSSQKFSDILTTTDHRITASKSFDNGLDDNNLDDSKIASALKYNYF